jgi:hypothetical protein
MIDRIVRAIRLDPTLYREVADGEQYTDEAVVVVIGVTLLSAIGTLIGAAMNDGRPLLNFIVQVGNMLIFGWLLWAVVAYFVGTALGGKSSITEMARTLAYANAPRLLGLLGFIPCAGALISLAGLVLTIAAGVVAIRESMEFDTTNAVVTAVLGFGVYIVASLILAFFLGGLGVLGMIVRG